MSPREVTVTGSFTRRNGRPVQGLVRFTPSRLWVVTDGITWACLAPEVVTEMDGSFTVQVTPTDCDVVPWHYIVDTPAGQYDLPVPWRANGSGYSLRGLVDEHHPGPRAPH